MLKVVASGIAIFAVAGLIWLLSLVAGGGAKAEQGRIVLRYGRGFRAIGLMGVVCALLAVIVFLVLMFVGQMSDGALLGVSILVAVFLIPAIPLVLEGYRREIVLDDEGISARGWFGPVGEFAWDEITKVEWQQMGEKYVVRAGKKKISLNGYLEGLGAFEQICQEKLDPQVYGKTFGGQKTASPKPAATTKPAPPVKKPAAAPQKSATAAPPSAKKPTPKRPSE